MKITMQRFKYSVASFFFLGIFLGLSANNLSVNLNLSIMIVSIICLLFSAFKLIKINDQEFDEICNKINALNTDK